MFALITRLERFLNLHRISDYGRLVRARAVYYMGFAFILTQAINLVAMTVSYGQWTMDHTTSIVVCALVVFTIINLRYSQNYTFFAGLYSTLIVAGTLAVALPENTGINSAMLPFYVLGIVMNGFVSGWRATTVFGVISLGLIWFLWWWSSRYNFTPIYDVDAFHTRNFQRAMQASLAIVMITTIGAFFARDMHAAFADLEAGIEKAQSGERAKTEFLATMSHELRTPMNGILGISDLLLETNLDDEQKDLVNMINSSSEDLQSIIGNVLLFSQLESGKLVLNQDSFDTQSILRRVMQPFAARAKQKGIALRADISTSLPKSVIGDAERIQTVLSILLDNAVAFTETGNITIRISLSNGQADTMPNLVFAVHDTGIGIAAEHHEMIFGRFSQVDNSIKRAHGGIGLGLTIARDLARLMGGDIDIKSRVSRGSVFTLSVPVSVPASVTAPTTPVTSPQPVPETEQAAPAARLHPNLQGAT